MKDKIKKFEKFEKMQKKRGLKTEAFINTYKLCEYENKLQLFNDT